MTALATSLNRPGGSRIGAWLGRNPRGVVTRHRPADAWTRARLFRPFAPCTLEMIEQEEQSVIRANGDLRGCEEVSGLHQRCQLQMTTGIKTLRIDLSQVEFADTKLVACLLDLKRTARSRGIRMGIAASPAVSRWISLNLLEDILLPPGEAPLDRADPSDALAFSPLNEGGQANEPSVAEACPSKKVGEHCVPDSRLTHDSCTGPCDGPARPN